jgi:hypothetical protein
MYSSIFSYRALILVPLGRVADCHIEFSHVAYYVEYTAGTFQILHILQMFVFFFFFFCY